MGLAKKLEMRPSTVSLPSLKTGKVIPAPVVKAQSKSGSSKKIK
jgi:hypothetical protein